MFGNFASMFLDKKTRTILHMEIRRKMLSFCNNGQKLVLNIDFIS
jgi:hypothetical protein